eukprot:gene54280-63203_t
MRRGAAAAPRHALLCAPAAAWIPIAVMMGVPPAASAPPTAVPAGAPAQVAAQTSPAAVAGRLLDPQPVFELRDAAGKAS